MVKRWTDSQEGSSVVGKQKLLINHEGRVDAGVTGNLRRPPPTEVFNTPIKVLKGGKHGSENQNHTGRIR